MYIYIYFFKVYILTPGGLRIMLPFTNSRDHCGIEERPKQNKQFVRRVRTHTHTRIFLIFLLQVEK
jgi:hypothetical protein